LYSDIKLLKNYLGCNRRFIFTSLHKCHNGI